MSFFTLDPRLKFKLASMTRGKNYDGIITHSCNVPTKAITVDYQGDCFICDCDGWLPISVGKIESFTSLDAVWNSPVAKVLQDDIDKKKFTWCAVKNCGIIDQDIQLNEAELLINTDESCNLACPSCRREQIMHTQGPFFDQQLSRTSHLINLLEKFSDPLKIVMSGNGDPLASLILRPLIIDYQPKKNQWVLLKTNGLLLQKTLTKSKMVSNIKHYSISVDAGSKEVYENVRRPGRWKNLIENLDYLQDLSSEHNAKVDLNFVIQKNNFRDLENFIDLCQKYQYNGVITQLTDWGTWNVFSEHNVLDKNHIDYQSAIGILKSIEHTYDRLQFDSFILDIIKQHN
jgi:molybdenum cofactor biosynthesis enzyme MoaA